MKLKIDIEKKSYEVTVEFLDGGRLGQRAWEPGEIEVPESVTRPRKLLKLQEDLYCRAPIAGRVANVLAIAGQSIKRNEPVMVIEAMKMEVQISPVVDGVLKTIHVKPGDMVAPGQLVFELS